MYGVIRWRAALPWRRALRRLPLARGPTMFMAPAGLTLRLPWLLLDPDGASALNRIRPLFMAKAGLTLTRRVRATETVTIIGKRYASPGITQKNIARRLGP